VNRGDFYATMPGGFARELNPVLWNSPDLAESWAYQQDVYLYGPTQYLTMFPVVYLFDSYAEIASFLRYCYALLIGLSVFLLWRAIQLIQPAEPRVAAALFCATAFFFPLHQAFLQREFEVVVLFVTTAALSLLLRRRESAAAALMGYIAWFKFFSLIWLPYLALRRWSAAVLTFAAVSCLVAVATVVGLGTSSLSALGDVIQTQLDKRTNSAVMCVDWEIESVYSAERNSSWADAGWALCSLGDRFPWLPVPEVYAALLVGLAGLFLVGFMRLERGGPLDWRDETWRRALEVSVLIVASSTLVHAHYYYLSKLIVPLGILLARYLAPRTHVWWKLALWLSAYLLLAVFAVPPSLAWRLTGADVWWLYMRHTLYFPGELLLAGLVFWEYLTIPVARARVAVTG
jgi:hypothetical protein